MWNKLMAFRYQYERHEKTVRKDMRKRNLQRQSNSGLCSDFVSMSNVSCWYGCLSSFWMCRKFTYAKSLTKHIIFYSYRRPLLWVLLNFVYQYFLLYWHWNIRLIATEPHCQAHTTWHLSSPVTKAIKWDKAFSKRKFWVYVIRFI